MLELNEQIFQGLRKEVVEGLRDVLDGIDTCREGQLRLSKRLREIRTADVDSSMSSRLPAPPASAPPPSRAGPSSSLAVQTSAFHPPYIPCAPPAPSVPPTFPGASPGVVRFGRVIWSPFPMQRRDQVFLMAHAAWRAVPGLFATVTDISVAEDREYVEIVFSAVEYARAFVASWQHHRHSMGEWAVLRVDEL
ncbi:hypothetical protein C8T65DRAFT_737264 [Cerioporus squamosus]|nr:hypothetical protein C8T65DRAFT_737264 [Cerioporus squamosus]